jgi:hypothetical protein
MDIRGIGDFVTLLAQADAGTFIPLLTNLAAVLGVAGVILLLLGLGVRWDKRKWLTLAEKPQWRPLVAAFLLIGTAVGLSARQSPPVEAPATAAKAPTEARSGSMAPAQIPGSAALVQLPPSPPRSISAGGFGFDEGIMGWIPESRGDTRAVVAVAHQAGATEGGTSALRLDVDLAGGDPVRSKGEAWGELAQPRDLRDRQLVATLYAPAEARGDPSAPNGFQLFVKDDAHRALYGTYTRVRPGQWMAVELTVSDAAPAGGWMKEGFDPSRIVAVGVKIAAAGGSTARYRGPVYLDALDW